METENEIFFYGKTNKFGEFSNFYQSNDNDGKLFLFENIECTPFNCSEQYFVYYKVLTFEPNNGKLLMKILNETNPTKIKSYGGKKYLKTFDKDIWDKISYDIMLNGIRLKFNQSEKLKNLLLSTKNKTIYEASHRDKIWGIGLGIKKAIITPKNEYGKNLLGKALMELREEIRKDQPKSINDLLKFSIIQESTYNELIKIINLDEKYKKIIVNEIINKKI